MVLTPYDILHVNATHALKCVCAIVACSLLLMSCGNDAVAPPADAPFAVDNVAMYDGFWKDAGFGAKFKSATNGVVNSMMQSPHIVNEIIVAGAYDQVYNSSSRLNAAGLALVNLTRNIIVLVEGDGSKPFYTGGPYTTAEFHPASERLFFAGGSGEVSNAAPGTVGPVGRYEDPSREWTELHDTSVTITGTVNALARAGQDLYIAGSFSNPFGLPNSANLVRYDIPNKEAFSMQTLQSGGGATVIQTLEIDGTSLLVGGSFASIGGVPASSIARWNGSAWERLDDGLTGFVRDIMVSNGVVYAAGRFYTADRMFFNMCARYDGDHWTMLGALKSASGATAQDEGHALAVYGGRVVLGGRFATTGDPGNPGVNNIAVWNSTDNTWNTLEGGGVTHSASTPAARAEVNALVVVGDRLYVSGRFDKARVK